jgi:phage gp46-like protein
VDTALEDGDFRLDSNGRPKQIGGVQELLQRAMIRLNVPLGSFAYDTALGSRLHTLQTDDVSCSTKAIAMAQEALRQLPEVTVEGANCSTQEPGIITIQLGYDEKTTEMEVKL